ncbi:hypothetical protein VVAX_04387 [Variovorax paradoxus]|uniref:Uncharacterized protein n=1 Tax=Variovorax paradoxus TaxID=34073 RepID=A0A679JNJ1_VARPD|nr:hypothetical protein VVAX_04387 [Variovorax paradoxus]
MTDDAQAFRLAVRLELKVKYHAVLGQALVWEILGKEHQVNVEDCGHDRYVATRRAIVRAAAEISREQGEGGR